MIPRKIRIALSLALLALSSHALALPTGPTVVTGSATFTTTGGTLTITNSNSTIINWQNFSISAGELTRFNQPSTASTVLNRVTSLTPSSLLGALTSNGNVFLINPNGVIVGPGATISVGGFSTMSNLSDANFLAGNYGAGIGGAINSGGNLSVQVATLGGGATVALSTGGGSVLGGSVNVSGGASLQSFGAITTVGGTVALGSVASGGSISLTAAGGGITSGGSGLTITAAGSPVQPGGFALSNKSPVPQGSAPPIRAASPPVPALTGIVIVTSVSLNLEKREVGF